MTASITIVLTREQAHTAVEALRRLANSRLAVPASGNPDSMRDTAADAARMILAELNQQARSANDDPRRRPR